MVVDFGTNRKRVCDVLLVINDIAGFLLKTATHPYSTRILGIFPWTRLPTLGSDERRPYRLITRIITFELIQPVRLRYIIVTDRQTDRPTDRRASRGKKKAKTDSTNPKPDQFFSPKTYTFQNFDENQNNSRSFLSNCANTQTNHRTNKPNQNISPLETTRYR